MIKYENIIQGTDEWHAMRDIRPTASNASRILTAGGKDSTSWAPYVREMVDAEVRPRSVREYGIWQGNRHTERGKQTEAEARDVFMERNGFIVAEVGFVTRDDDVWGCSPDGLIKSNEWPRDEWGAGIEIKCPDGPKHLLHKSDGTLPAEYLQQVHCSMVVTGLPAWYFMSYCEYYEPLILRIERDAYTAKMELAMFRFQNFYRVERERLLAFKTKGGAK